MANEVTFTGQSGATWRYWTDQPLGTPGGFGGVYAAEGSDGTPMAVKVVNKQRPSGVLDDRLLRREIDIGKRVVDSGSEMLLPVIDAADANDALLLVMTRAEGALAAGTSSPPTSCATPGAGSSQILGSPAIRRSEPRIRPLSGGARSPTWRPNSGN